MPKHPSKDFLELPHDKTIIVATLNWGLGHSSRCIPIIRSALGNGNKIIIASDGDALSLLRQEFPSLQYYALPSYKIKYPYTSILFNLMLQAFPILKAIYQEKKAIEKIVVKEKADLIISDNRYGCRSQLCRTAFITHQLYIHHQNAIISKIINSVNRILLQNFEEIWVPDYIGKESLGGRLSQDIQPSLSHKLTFIGPLSRLYPCSQTLQKVDSHILVLLSGPEPQRTILQDLLLLQFQNFSGKIVFVCGTSYAQIKDVRQNIEFVAMADSHKVQELMCSASVVISRSGYSTIMDLYCTQKKAILIPTPGQLEQEYLANIHHKKNTVCISQNELYKINLPTIIENLLQD